VSLTGLYIGSVVLSLIATNALILLARAIQQQKTPPQEEDYLSLEREMKQLEFTVENQTQDVMDLQLRVEELKEQLAKEMAEKNIAAEAAKTQAAQAKAASA
jgi:hypothetical protein